MDLINMKALIRHKNETVLEGMKIPGIDWRTGAPLTNPYWEGGPYTLVENYIHPAEETEQEQTVVSSVEAERIAEIAELKARLAALENEI